MNEPTLKPCNLNGHLWDPIRLRKTKKIQAFAEWFGALAVFRPETSNRLWALGELDNDDKENRWA